MIVIFDRQHYGKPGKADMGAGYDLDNDGKVEVQEQEANLTPLYFLPAKAALEKMGHSVYVLDQGWYSDRHKKANAIAAANKGSLVAYIACHINAGKGDYSVMISDERSTRGASLALCLSDALSAEKLSGLKRNLTRSASATNEWKRGFSTISGIFAGPANIAGVCFEPYFIDRPEHAWLASPEGGEAIAKAIVAGLTAWR